MKTLLVILFLVGVLGVSMLAGCMNKPVFVQVENQAKSDKAIYIVVSPENPISIAPKLDVPVTANAGDEAVKTGAEAAKKITPTGAASTAVEGLTGGKTDAPGD